MKKIRTMDDLKNVEITVSLDRNYERMLSYYAEKHGVSRSDALCKGIEALYTITGKGSQNE